MKLTDSFYTLFPLPNSWLLIASLLLAFISICLSYGGKYNCAIVCLFISGFILRLFMSYLDPFLHEWDERYHALVAEHNAPPPQANAARKQLGLHEYTQWTYNHIWLHKQPLFLWQMALSMRIFGVSVFAMRYPNVLMGSLSILLVYRSSVLMTGNKAISFMAALLMCFSFYHLEMVSGNFGMDENDVAFDFYVLASIWAYAEYREKKILKYAILTGLFAGCAVLNKWALGLLVFSGWGVVLLGNITKRENAA